MAAGYVNSPPARLWSPCAALVWAVYLLVLAANYGYPMPTQFVRSRYKSTDFDVEVFGAVPNAQWASYLGCHVPNAQSRGGIFTLWYISLVYATPVPKIKMARATSSL